MNYMYEIIAKISREIIPAVVPPTTIKPHIDFVPDHRFRVVRRNAFSIFSCTVPSRNG